MSMTKKMKPVIAWAVKSINPINPKDHFIGSDDDWGKMAIFWSRREAKSYRDYDDGKSNGDKIIKVRITQV